MLLKQYELNKFHFAFYESVYTTACLVYYCLYVQYSLLCSLSDSQTEDSVSVFFRVI